jgi:Zn-dependent protease with chaperone function
VKSFRQIAIAVVIIRLATNAAEPSAGTGHVRPAELTPDLCRRIDRLATQISLENLTRQKIDVHGNLAAWIIKRAPVSPADELAGARREHELIIRTVRHEPAPSAVHDLLQHLVAELPPHLNPLPFPFTLTVIDSEEPNVFCVGGGYLYITAPLLDSLLQPESSGREMLAFLLAHEIGHVALGHFRLGYQSMLLKEEIDRGISLSVDNVLLERILKTTINPAPTLARFLYTREQEYEADLFALHLCRNAGVNLDRALNAVRFVCLLEHPRLASDPSFRPNPAADRSLLVYYLSAHPEPLRRLKRLQMERTGEPDDGAEFGLLEFDRRTKGMHRAADRAFGDSRAVILIHGMEGGANTYRELIEGMTASPQGQTIRLLVFVYPNDQSLARSGVMLHRELRRVFDSRRNVDFVCHSAGGLVFRYYAEVLGGEFRYAVFQGTPHGGSDLATLRCLLEATQFIGDLKLGYPAALANTLIDGHGQITQDLHPDSLLLRYLDRHPRPANRYYVIRGRVLRPTRALALTGAVKSARLALERRIDREISSDFMKRMARSAVATLKLPREVGAGDLAVAVDRATLAGAAEIITTRHNHQRLKSCPEAYELIERVVFGSSQR